MNMKKNKKGGSWLQWVLLTGIILLAAATIASAIEGDWMKVGTGILWTALYVGFYLARDTFATEIRKRWFPRTVKPSGNSMEVVIVDSDQKMFHSKFGLTEERLSEIADQINDVLPSADPNRRLEDVMVEMSRACKHPNELMYMSFVIGCRVEADSNPVTRIFTSMMGGK